MSDDKQDSHTAAARRFRHDVMGIVGQMRGFSNLLYKELGREPSDRAQKSIGHIHNGTERLVGLLDGWFELQRQLPQEADEAIDLEHVLTRVVAEVQRDFPDRELQLNTQSLPTVLGRPELLHALFRPLVDNAFRYAEPEAPVQLDVLGQQGEGERVSVTLRDHGPGFDPKLVDDAFEPFRRLVPQGHSRGAGVGLAVARRIAEHLGGSLNADVAVGEGLTLTLTLQRA